MPASRAQQARRRPIKSLARRRWLLLLLPLLVGGSRDPGILLELDLEQFAVQATDLQREAEGPRLRVVVGSPAHPPPVGDYPVFGIVRNPGWRPGETARSYGAVALLPSMDGPLGVAKIPFARAGIALHGGADPLLVGKPASLGCVRALDSDVGVLLEWLEAQGVLAKARPQPDGEIHQSLRRPVRVVVR